MSLLVWLPLTRDLTQQGTSDITVSNNGATLNEYGKLGGKCYYFDGNAHWLEFSKTVGDLYSRDFSYAVWLKPMDDTRGVICSEYSSSGSSNIAFELTAARVVRLYWAGSPDLSPSACTLTKNVWSHVVITRSGNVAKFYINGVLKYTYSGTLANKTSTAKIRLGDDYRGGTSVSYMGYMNDFRIYDHCLSPKEVELLSRGLIAHYTLTGNGRGVDNILAGTPQNETTYTYPSSSYSDKWSKKTSIVPSASKYTLSFWAKSTVNGDKIRSHYYNPNTTTKCESSQGAVSTAADGLMDYTLSTEWKKYWAVYTQNSTTATKTVIFPRMHSTAGSGTVSIKNVKFEEGDKSTSWLPNSADSAYDTLGYNDTTEYDTSGNGYNGTCTNTIYSSDTPRYSVSTIFKNASSSYITLPAINIDMTQVSFSVRFKINSAQQWARIFDFGTAAEGAGYSIGLALGNNGTTLTVYGRRGSSSATLPDKQVQTISLNTWYHAVITLSGTTLKCYINGTLVLNTTISSAYPTLVIFTLLYLGKSIYSADKLLDGNISDFRVYSTILSDDAVKELYQSGATITNNGTLIGYELVEV